LAKAFEQAKDAFVSCAQCQIKSGAYVAYPSVCVSLFVARAWMGGWISNIIGATAYENAAQMVIELKRHEDAADLYKLASVTYIDGGNSDRAAQALISGAKAFTGVNPDKMIALYLDAIELYETEEREQFGLDAYSQTVAAMIRAKKFIEAGQLLDRLAAVYRKLDRKPALYKVHLSKLVVLFAAGDSVGASNVLQQGQQ